MTRFRFTIFAIAMIIAAGAAPQGLSAQATSGKVAFVAVRAVLEQTPGYDQAESVWNQESAGFTTQMTMLQSQMDSATSAFEQQSVMLSASNRATEQQKLQDLATELNRQVEQLQDQAAVRQRELLNPIEERVLAVIEGLRAEGNFSVVFDVSNNGNTIVAADKSLDLTQLAIDRLGGGAAGPAGEN